MSDATNKGGQYMLSTQPEIIRQNQKDEYYQSYLKSKLIDASEILMPWLLNYRSLSRNEDIVKLIAGLVYYGMTTFRGNQTLGEEYTQLAQYNENHEGVDEQRYPIISKKRKALYIFLATVFPLISHRILRKYYTQLKQTVNTKLPENSFLSILIRNLPDYDGMVSQVVKVHLAAFFIEGIFLQLSRRFSSIKLIFTKKPQPHNIHYRNVGVIMAIQIVGELIKFLYKIYRIYRKENTKGVKDSSLNLEEERILKRENSQKSENNTEEAKICTLCFDARKNTACTPCGHLFCWECILKQCTIKEECPQCRRPCKANKIIQLRNME